MRDMSTEPILRIESTKPEDTFRAGEQFAKILEPGDAIQLVGDLGAGKTQFVRGLAQGLGSADEVASPSFTLSREYACPNDLTLYHFDFYRLDSPGIMRNEVAEVVGDSHAIVALEWGMDVADVLTSGCYQIEITSGKKAEDRLIKIQKIDGSK